MQEKTKQKFFVLAIISFELVVKKDLLQRVYLSSAVSMLTTSSRIPDIMKAGIFLCNIRQSNSTIW